MEITGRGIHGHIRYDLPVNLYIDLIDPISQVFVMIRLYAVFIQQRLLKICLPCRICGIVCNTGSFLHCLDQ